MLWYLIERPHRHRYLPTRFDDSLPYIRENYLAIGAADVVMALLDMIGEKINVHESLLNEISHFLPERREIS
jgi:hypothetical protein